MKKIMKKEFASDETKYAYKCLRCGGQLHQTEGADDWDNLDLDRLERHYCPNCDSTFEYYYSLDCVQYTDENEDQSTVVFSNKSGEEHVELKAVEGQWNLPEAEVAD